MAKIIDGKLVSQSVRDDVALQVKELNEKGVSVELAVIIVGNNPASRTYVNNKKKACEATGIVSVEYALPEETTMTELLELIEKLNNDKKTNGILCQLPLPQTHLLVQGSFFPANLLDFRQIMLFFHGSSPFHFGFFRCFRISPMMLRWTRLGRAFSISSSGFRLME